MSAGCVEHDTVDKTRLSGAVWSTNQSCEVKITVSDVKADSKIPKREC